MNYYAKLGLVGFPVMEYTQKTSIGFQRCIRFLGGWGEVHRCDHGAIQVFTIDGEYTLCEGDRIVKTPDGLLIIALDVWTKYVDDKEDMLDGVIGETSKQKDPSAYFKNDPTTQPVKKWNPNGFDEFMKRNGSSLAESSIESVDIPEVVDRITENISKRLRGEL